jgi:hypothetical protein
MNAQSLGAAIDLHPTGLGLTVAEGDKRAKSVADVQIEAVKAAMNSHTPFNALSQSYLDLDHNRKLNETDVALWSKIASGTAKWSDFNNTLPTFANGGITNGPSIAGEGMYHEAVIPLLDGRTVRARIDGQADNKEIVDELKEANRQLAAMEKRLTTLETNSRLDRNEPKRKAA